MSICRKCGSVIPNDRIVCECGTVVNNISVTTVPLSASPTIGDSAISYQINREVKLQHENITVSFTFEELKEATLKVFPERYL